MEEEYEEDIYYEDLQQIEQEKDNENPEIAVGGRTDSS